MATSADVTAGTNAVASVFNALRGDVVLGLKVFGTETDAATVTLDFSSKTKGNVRTLTLGGNRTLATTGDVDGQMLTIYLIQDATGTRTVTWWSGITWLTGDGSIPTLPTAANKVISLSIHRVSVGVYYGYINGFNS